MSIEQRVRKLEDGNGIGGAVVRLGLTFGGRFYRDCNHYQDQSCKRVVQEAFLPKGVKIKYVVDNEGTKEENPCNECEDYKEKSQPQPLKEEEPKK